MQQGSNEHCAKQTVKCEGRKNVSKELEGEKERKGKMKNEKK